MNDLGGIVSQIASPSALWNFALARRLGARYRTSLSGGNFMRKIAVIGLALLLSATLASCATVGSPKAIAIANQVPPNYREQIIAYVKATFKDPYSIKSAGISGPTTSFVGLVNGGDVPGVCITMNAKNSFGAYIGQQVLSVAFKNGVVIGMSEPLFTTCQGVVFEPFPELEMIT